MCQGSCPGPSNLGGVEICEAAMAAAVLEWAEVRTGRRDHRVLRNASRVGQAMASSRKMENCCLEAENV